MPWVYVNSESLPGELTLLARDSDGPAIAVTIGADTFKEPPLPELRSDELRGVLIELLAFHVEDAELGAFVRELLWSERIDGIGRWKSTRRVRVLYPIPTPIEEGPDGIEGSPE